MSRISVTVFEPVETTLQGDSITVRGMKRYQLMEDCQHTGSHFTSRYVDCGEVRLGNSAQN